MAKFRRYPQRRRRKREDEFHAHRVRGKVKLAPDGSGVLVPNRGGGEIYLAPGEVASVREGEEVTVETRRARKGRVRGRIITFHEREERHKRTVGVLYRTQEGWAAIPDLDGPRVQIDHASRGGGQDGDAVVVELWGRPDGRGRVRGRVVEVLGDPDNPRVQIAMLLHSLGRPLTFSEASLAEAEAMLPPDAERVLAEDPSRRDLRHILHVTIDGADARDFDDAVAAHDEGRGVRVWVSIADVSYYVQEGTALDEAARSRGTSVYFPHMALPMLPKRLSNNLCSLREGEPRLALTCEMLITPEGNIAEGHIYPSVIQSSGRLTYEQVQQYFNGGSLAHPQEVLITPMLAPLRQASRYLRDERSRRGGLDLDLPEYQILTRHDGRPESIRLRERLESHRLIEDLMIAANEWVARESTRWAWPGVYRVHEPPGGERLDAFVAWAKAMGFKVESKSLETPRGVAQLARELQKREQAEAGHTLLLRSLSQARYTEDNLGHFGLASEAYLHFTSPIRRYPDLLVHRSLRARWAGRAPPDNLDERADLASRQEREAVSAERAMHSLMSAQIAQAHIGEELRGVITGVTPVGLFVRLEALMVEGFLPMGAISEMRGEFYDYVEPDLVLVGRRSGHRYALGDRLEVVIAAANPRQRRIDLALVRSGPSRRGRGRASRRAPAPRGSKAARTQRRPRGRRTRKA